MKLNSLTVRNFRNYENSVFDWHPKINIIYGKNAQGKTNLLEAIYYLSTGYSFRGQNEEKLENWTGDYFFLEAELEREEDYHTISAGYQQKKKLWKKDGTICKKISEIVGFLHTVVFTPEDLEIVKKGPDIRRNFLDREMLQIFSGYHQYLNNYKKALLQRNNLLKQIEFEKIYNETEQDMLLLPWENQLKINGAIITKKRAEIIKRLDKISCEIHSFLSNNEEKLKLQYEATVPFTDRDISEKDLEEQLAEAYKNSRHEDMKRGFTTVGPHRDDFKIIINDIDARHYGSQGQQKTAALSVKLSEIELVKELNGYYPILLLDDVLSELDKNRREALLKMAFDKSQIFITTTDIDREALGQKNDCKKYHIIKGTLREE